MAIDLSELFDTAQRDSETKIAVATAQRQRLRTAPGEVLLDSFRGRSCRCLFWRGICVGRTMFRLAGASRMTTVDAGGWILMADAGGPASYWIPVLPMTRRLDEHGRILEEAGCPVTSLSVSGAGAEIVLQAPEGKSLDLVVWEIGPGEDDFLSGLEAIAVSEQQPVYLWGSHGIYRRPADLYRNLVHGSIFDLRFSWPHKRRAYSENDAHALYLALRNRELATGKSMYRRLRDQVLLSVLDRQDRDGAWRQGIWSRDMEHHFRIHNKAMHLLMDCYCEQPDKGLLEPLGRAADHLAAQATEVMDETWFLHDSLEQDKQAIHASLPGWRHCGNPMKSPANTLVLNTHIDTLIVLHRYQQISGRDDFQPVIDSARRVLHRILDLKPAERFYRLVFGAIYLTLLPTNRARALPLPARAVKRFAREWLIPLLPSLKCHFPRLVMPGGFVDRSLSLSGLAHAYLGIHLMDFARYERCFPGQAQIAPAIAGMMAFAKKWDLLASWAEDPQASYGIGYWVEALYQMALLDERPGLRQALAESAVLSERCGLGLPPSINGTNLEMLALEAQSPCPIPADGRLRSINLARDDRREYLFLNPETEAVRLAFPDPLPELLWRSPGDQPGPRPPATLAAGKWVVAATA